MRDIINELKALSDKEYAKFMAKLTPNVDSNLFIGIRVPKLREYAKELYKSNEYSEFLNTLPHKYFEEYMLHSLLIEQIKDYDTCINYLDKFLPYIDNWCVCDTMRPKSFKKNIDKLIKDIYRWGKSKHTYTYRFAIEQLMNFYLDEYYDEKYMELVLNYPNDDYYTKMMVAWFNATALTKQYNTTIKYIEDKKFSKWVHNKSIQKAIESLRIDKDIKEYLKTLRID